MAAYSPVDKWSEKTSPPEAGKAGSPDRPWAAFGTEEMIPHRFPGVCMQAPWNVSKMMRHP